MEMTARILRASNSDDNPAKLIREAEALFRRGYAQYRSNPGEAERDCREALDKLRDAYLLTKRPQVMKQLHRYGKKINETFRCRFEFKRGSYWDSCPVSLSHLTHGVSPGIIGTEICSICESNMLECDHVKGWTYGNVPARRIKGVCNICRKERACAHKIGQLYSPVTAFAFMRDIRFDHNAIVENPKDPLACITAHSMDREGILKFLPEREKAAFEYGKTTLYCHHCRGCSGSESDQRGLASPDVD